MPKKLSEIQKRDIIISFKDGETIEQLSEKYSITKATITRHLKKEVDLKTFNSLVKKNKKNKKESKEDNKIDGKNEINENEALLEKQIYPDTSFYDQEFIEITPLENQIDSETQKDLSSISISEIDLPPIVYMIVDNKIELETKLLKDYPDWQFLADNELNRKTIEIYFDIKIAKRFCKKEQKVIKVPNTNVFRLASPFLVSKGISRIVCPDNLIAL